MDTIEAMRVFVAVAKSGSFTAAAQALDLAPSVVTKRIAQLEKVIGTKLLLRTTRRVTSTATGDYHLTRMEAAIALHDETLSALRKGVERLRGSIRIKVPTTMGFVRLNALLRQFVRNHPDVDLDVLLLDGPMNPATEGIDLAITAFSASFDGVVDEFLWPIRRGLYASPAYLATCPPLEHPRQLEGLPCLVYQPIGPTWPFLSEHGIMTVTVRTRLSSNDMMMLIASAKEQDGIGVFSDYLVGAAIDEGTLVKALPEYPVPDLWVKAMAPIDRLALPRVNALLDFIRSNADTLHI
jgi:DNA-binding transcriptional LysR family regulator